ncbi:hyaluronidase-4-like isoform X2 [Rhinatrema bivittatum]|nr:hyaluronidase-4-like isoform X2 [Rhinatrema bivittatum]
MRLNTLAFRTHRWQLYHMLLSFLLLLGHDLSRCYSLKPSLPSFIQDQPFVVFWNAPTTRCASIYGVPLNLKSFSIVHNIQENFMGENITIFYYDQLGLYPYYVNTTAVNGGCPQNASLKNHLDKMTIDIDATMPSRSFFGLAVIDWEAWRPQWVRNWDKKNIYRLMSQQLVKDKNPNWTSDEIDKQAQWEFETAAQTFMTTTIKLANFQRPAGKWGYYLYPECYNYNYQIDFGNFTGHCPDIEVQRNNQLQWLWEESKALYPSIYIEEILKSSNQGNKFVRAKVSEALRVAELPSSLYSLPVYVYARPFYTYTLKPLTQTDLIYSIGQTAALGAQGLVLWGDVDYSRNKTNCQIVQKYLNTTLGPYIVNVTMATQLCSQFVCNNHGRCLRKDPDADTYLHLSSDSFRIQVTWTGNQSGISVTGSMSQNQMDRMKAEFVCHCYEGWTGDNCQGASKSPGLRLQQNLCMLTAIVCGLFFMGHLQT